MSVIDQGARDGSEPEAAGFWPAFGSASLILAAFAFGFSKLGSMVIQEMMDAAENPAAAAATVRWVSLGVMVVFAVMLLFAIGLGLASLAGFGKRQGTSRPVFGLLGIGLAGIMAWGLVDSLMYARQRAEQARAEGRVIGGQSADGGAAVEGALAEERVVLAEHGIELAKPAGAWMLGSPEETKRANPMALASAMNRTTDIEKVILGMVFVEQVDEREFSGLTPDDWANLASQASQAPEVEIEKAEEMTFQGREATLVQFTSRGPKGGRIRTRQIIIPDGPRVVRLFCAGSTGHTDAAGAAFAPFFEAVTVRP